MVRAFSHGEMGLRIDPSWGGPIELFLVPASVPRLVNKGRDMCYPVFYIHTSSVIVCVCACVCVCVCVCVYTVYMILTVSPFSFQHREQVLYTIFT